MRVGAPRDLLLLLQVEHVRLVRRLALDNRDALLPPLLLERRHAVLPVRHALLGLLALVSRVVALRLQGRLRSLQRRLCQPDIPRDNNCPQPRTAGEEPSAPCLPLRMWQQENQ